MAITIIPLPARDRLLRRSRTGGNFLAWQLFRRPNHSLLFYRTAVPLAIGVGGLRGRRRRSRRPLAPAATGRWRETLLVSWIIVPALFFELWPVKGFQYLLPCAPAVAVLLRGRARRCRRRRSGACGCRGSTRAGCRSAAGVADRASRCGSATLQHIRPSTRHDVPRRFRRRARAVARWAPGSGHTCRRARRSSRWGRRWRTSSSSTAIARRTGCP